MAILNGISIHLYAFKNSLVTKIIIRILNNSFKTKFSFFENFKMIWTFNSKDVLLQKINFCFGILTEHETYHDVSFWKSEATFRSEYILVRKVRFIDVYNLC
jgi:hypothetical protein